MKSRIRKPVSRRVFEVFNAVFFILIMIICILPIWHVFCASLSDASWVLKQEGLILYIHNLSLEGYRLVFQKKEIWTGYLNTLFYAGMTMIIGMVVTVMMAYTCSRRDCLWSNALMFIVSFTMLFNGGMIASYVVNVDLLHLFDSRWAVVLPMCLNAFYLIILRTAIQSVPESLIESARLDGAGHMIILFQIVLPLIKATLATIALYYIIMQWNSWFQASIYLRSRDKFPLQLILKEILITGESSMDSAQSGSGEMIMTRQLLKYCTIMVSTVPVLCVYPFVQKYFESGVMIGAVKG